MEFWHYHHYHLVFVFVEVALFLLFGSNEKLGLYVVSGEEESYRCCMLCICLLTGTKVQVR